MDPITPNSEGLAVQDVQRRLMHLGYDLGQDGVAGVFAEQTLAAVRSFQADEGLGQSGVVDEGTWAALVDATFVMGDRTLYLKLPYFHGSDVREMQKALNVLGFGSGQVDGIFGAHTEQALREFQRNVGIAPDGIAGSWTFDAIARLHQVWEGRDATPHTGARAGFSRAAEVLSRSDVCFWGADAISRNIANRIANLAMATTASSMVRSADTRTAPPTASTLLVEITFAQAPTGGAGGDGQIPFVVFADDEAGLAARLSTAMQAARDAPMRICVGLPAYSDDGLGARLRQHYTVTLLDALCAALS